MGTHRHLVAITLLLLFGLGRPAPAQTVTTVVSGPSYFDDGLTLGADGTIYASYYYGARVSKITPAGVVTALATGLVNPNGSAVDADGNVYVAEAGANRVTRIAPDGTTSQYGPTLPNPTGLVFDLDGSLLVAQYQGSRISRIATDGTLTTVMIGSPLNGPVGLQLDAAGNLYVGNFSDGRIIKRTPGGQVDVIGDLPGWLGFIALAGDAIYATGFQANRIYRAPIDGSGMTVFAGTGATGQADGDVSTATFDGPNGIVATADGTSLYITDFNTRSLRRIDGLTAASAVGEFPAALRLDMNASPNPFNPRTTIRYFLPDAGRVKLEIFDTRGRRVRTVVDAEQSAGDHQIDLGGDGLVSGIYLARLGYGGSVVTRKLSLVK